jgi:hypothetical protein
MEAADPSYPLLDLTISAPILEGRATVDPQELARQLKHISDAVAPVLADGAPAEGGFGLDSIEIALTIGAEGGIAFIAKGTAEASITVKFARPSS